MEVDKKMTQETKGEFPSYFGTVQVKNGNGKKGFKNIGVLTLWKRDVEEGSNRPIIGGYLDVKEKQADGTLKVVDRKFVSLWDKPPARNP